MELDFEIGTVISTIIIYGIIAGLMWFGPAKLDLGLRIIATIAFLPIVYFIIVVVKNKD